MANINQLSYTDTFKTWFDRTNTVISTVNGITAYNMLAGDGIGITSSNNVFTISHGTLVNTGVTFAGNVKFNGSVSFASSPTVSTVVIGVTPKTTGITAGNIVRIDGGGLTLAKADSSTNSEVLGIVVGEDASSNIVAVAGAVNNTTFASTIANVLGVAGGTLTAGQVYFLSPTTAGVVTTTEPTTINQVSKPVLLGITLNQAAILPYRGSLIGVSAGLSGGYIGDSKVIVTIDYSAPDPTYSSSGNPVNVGDAIFIASDYITTNNILGELGEATAIKLYGKCNNSSSNNVYIHDGSLQFATSFTLFSSQTYPSDSYVGLISRIIQNDTTNDLLTVEITLPGGVFETDISELDSMFWDGVLNTANSSQFINFTLTSFSSFSAINSSVMYNNYAETTWGKLLKNTNNKAVIAVYDPSAKIPKNDYITAINNQIATVQNNPVIPTNNNLLINPHFKIAQYNEGISLTNSPTSQYVTPIIDGWYFTSSGITYTNLSVSKSSDSTLPGVYIKADYNLDPLTYLWRTLMTNSTSDGSVTGAAYSNISLVMKPAIENVQLISNEVYPDCSYRFTFKIVTGVTGSGPSGTGVTVYPFINAYSATPPTTGYTCGITGEMAFRAMLPPTRILANNTVTVAGSFAATSSRYDMLDGISSTNGVWFPHGTTLTAAQATTNFLGAGNNKWISFGVAFDPSTVEFRVTEARLTRGSFAPSTPYFHDNNYEYNKCKPFYQRSYAVDVATRTAASTPVTFTQIPVNNQAVYPFALVQFPVEMCRNPDGCTVYSLLGNTGEAYITGLYKDVYDTSGVLKNLPWDLTGVRSPLAKGNNIKTQGMNKNGFYVRIDGTETLDTIAFHWVADSRFKDSM